MVVVSSAVRADNPEVAAARARGIPVIPRAEMLGELMRVKDGVAVAGSHGKTTTTTMIAVILAEAGLDPTAIIGGKARAFGSNARLGQGEILVAEADESDGSFRHLFPTVALITNIDREHLDHFGSLEALESAFLDFAEKVPFYGLVVIGADNPTAARLPARLTKRHLTYGLEAGDWRGEILEAGPTGTRFRVRVRDRLHGEARIRMPGVHYAENALGALCVADFLGVPFARGGRGAGGVPGRRPAVLAAGRGGRRTGRRRLRAPPDGAGGDNRRGAAARPAPAGGVPAAPLHADPRSARRLRAGARRRRSDFPDRRLPGGRGAASPAPTRRALLATFPAGAPVRHVARGRADGRAGARGPRPAIWCSASAPGDITAVPGELLAALGRARRAPRESRRRARPREPDRTRDHRRAPAGPAPVFPPPQQPADHRGARPRSPPGWASGCGRRARKLALIGKALVVRGLRRRRASGPGGRWCGT